MVREGFNQKVTFESCVLKDFFRSFPGGQSGESILDKEHSLSKGKEEWKDLPISCAVA